MAESELEMPTQARWKIATPVWAILWAMLIFATSCSVISRSGFVNTVGTRLPVADGTARFDRFWEGYWWVGVKGWHATEYAVLFGLIRLSWRVKTTLASFLVPMGLCVIYAASDEFHQTFVKYRGGTITDVLIDTGGMLVAAGICYLGVRWRQRGAVAFESGPTLTV
jgi:hypothetical protein